jgi:adenosylcobyric acid synthase
MVQGTSSWAGKSLLTTALARHYARRGIRVAPFKGLNMSNNARVGAGGEMGAAQYLQALAAGVPPDVRMNPVLVKPEGETRSQVVVLGRAEPELSRLPWRERAPRLWPTVHAALCSLADEHDLLLLEGAGSPAEINLADIDLANLRVADAADAGVVLVADIDRGGAFAHLYGTWALLAAARRARIGGFVLNRFRGDPALLAPGPERLRALTGVPTLGVLPMLAHDLPDEDGAAPPRNGDPGLPSVAVVRYPTASNLDEFRALEQVARLAWAEEPERIAEADLAILPGAKHVGAALAWLRRRGLDAALIARARAGRRVLGVCGGLQILGEVLRDPAGVEAAGHGLGLLPLETVYAPDKRARATRTAFGRLPAPWAPLSGREASGYEIRHGRSRPTAPVSASLPDGLGWVRGSVLGVYLHGLLEDPGLVGALLGSAPERRLEATFDTLADAVAAHLDTARLDALAGLA